MNMKNALILTYNRFPNGDAGSLRQESFAKLLENIGYTVTVIGMGTYTGNNIKKYHSTSYLSFRNKRNNLLSRVDNVFSYKNKLKQYLQSRKSVDLIMVVDIPIPSLLFIKKYSKKNSITLIHDSVEWYSPEQFKSGKLSLPYILKDIYNRKAIDANFKVISISSFLDNHFKLREIPSTIIPVIMDANSIGHIKNIEEGFVNFLYAGSPGKKDYIDEIIRGFCLLSKSELSKINIRLIGITREQLLKIGISDELLDYLDSSLEIMGRVSRDEVLEYLEITDFTILLRPHDSRYANAGFPTKVVESLMTGTPVICNITSDLGDYIIDMNNGIIVDDCSANSFAISLLKAIRLNVSERKQMQQNSRKTAEMYFDYKKYVDKFRLLINEGGDI